MTKDSVFTSRVAEQCAFEQRLCIHSSDDLYCQRYAAVIQLCRDALMQVRVAP